VSALPTTKQKSAPPGRGNFLTPPKKTSGLRSAQPKKKPPDRATISNFVPKWWLSTRKLEPILTDSYEVNTCKLSPDACSSKAGTRPDRKNRPLIHS